MISRRSLLFGATACGVAAAIPFAPATMTTEITALGYRIDTQALVQAVRELERLEQCESVAEQALARATMFLDRPGTA